MANESITQSDGPGEKEKGHEVREGAPPEGTGSPTAITAAAPAAAPTALSTPPAGDADASIARPVATYRGFDRFLAVAALVLVFFLGSFAVSDSEVLMNLATGRLIAEGQYEFGVDPFSFATEARGDAPATPWINHSWLYSWLLYLLHGAAGETGLAVIHALLGVALALVLLQVRDPRVPLLIGVFIVVMAFLALSVRFLLQPASLSLLLFAIVFLLLHRAGALGGIPSERVRPRLLWGVPLLCILWVNLDAWFILGPLTLGLVWAGSGLNGALGRGGAIPGKQLGLAFAASVAACLVNPHLHRAFLLPPELGFLLLNTGLPAPEALSPGAYALQEILPQQSRALYFLLGPFSGAYYSSAFQGANIAGWQFLTLLGLGSAAFLIKLLGTPPRQEGTPESTGESGATATGAEAPGALHLERLVPFAFFGILALLQVAMIPWFAIVGAVVCNLSFGEILLERGERAQRAIGRPSRLLGLLLVVVLLVLAWPGWLHAPFMHPSSPRRVAWTFAMDPSLSGMAQRLAEMKKDKHGERIFNFSLTASHYCAWHAPGVRCFMDTRYHLFPEQAKLHTQWKEALYKDAGTYFTRGLDPDAPLATAWRKPFEKWGVNHVQLFASVFQDVKARTLLTKLWLHGDEWTLRHGEGAIALFAWHGPRRGAPEDFITLRAREIFGGVPPQRRPPAGGSPPPLLPDTWDAYAKGMREPARPWNEEVMLHRYMFAQGSFGGPPPFPVVREFALQAHTAGLLASFPLAAPAEGLVPTPFVALALTDPLREMFNIPSGPSGRSLFRMVDFGPPAIPLLLVQNGRRAVAAAPFDVSGRLRLGDIYLLLEDNQEDYWTNYNGGQNPLVAEEWNKALNQAFPKEPESWKAYMERMRVIVNHFGFARRTVESVTNRNSVLGESPLPSFRKQLREMQVAAQFRLAADLAPDNLNAQQNLANYYARHHFLDLALVYHQRTLDVLEKLLEKTGDPERKRLLADQTEVKRIIKSLEGAVKERRNDLDLKAASILSPVFKGKDKAPPKWLNLYVHALAQPYTSTRGKSETTDILGRGLPLAALEYLNNLSPADIAIEEAPDFIYLLIDLKLRVGLVAEAMADLNQENVKKAKSLPIHRARALLAGVIGDYAEFDKQVAEMDKLRLAERVYNGTGIMDKELTLSELPKLREIQERVLVASLFAATPKAPVHVAWQPHVASAMMIDERLAAVRARRVEWSVLRGVMALESGDAAAAKKRFEESFEIAGHHAIHYSELILAQRYLALMAEQGK